MATGLLTFVLRGKDVSFILCENLAVCLLVLGWERHAAAMMCIHDACPRLRIGWIFCHRLESMVDVIAMKFSGMPMMQYLLNCNCLHLMKLEWLNCMSVVWRNRFVLLLFAKLCRHEVVLWKYGKCC